MAHIQARLRAIAARERGRGGGFTHGMDTGAPDLAPWDGGSTSVAIAVGNGEPTTEDPTADLGPLGLGDAAPPEDENIPSGDPGSILEVKRLDEVMDMLTGSVTIKPTPVDTNQGASNKGGKYDVYAFTVVRRFLPTGAWSSQQGKGKTSYNVTRVLDIRSEELRAIGAEVIGRVQGVSWNAKPLRVDPQVFIAWLPELQEHLSTLSGEEGSPTHTRHEHLSFLIDWLKIEYKSTLETLHSLISNGEITFDLLWALYVSSKTILHIPCPTTGEPRLVRLARAEKCLRTDMPGGGSPSTFDISGLSANLAGGGDGDNSKHLYRLVMEYLEVDVRQPGARFGCAALGTVIDIAGFAGARKISSLSVYPVKYYEGPGGPEGLKERLVERAKRWAGLAGGVQHLAYKGVAYIWRNSGGQWFLQKQSVDSRIMIDRQTFAENMPNYDRMTLVTKTLAGRDIERHALRAGTASAQDQLATFEELTDEQLMLAPPKVHGFSLSDKEWLEFSVELVEPFTWNHEAYENLVIPPDHKAVLTTLVEAQSSIPAAKVDDFVKGKGLGLVINLYGNPGTGKSLTAEAMSEHLKKPLYVVGAADLGTAANQVDSALSKILKISATWSAVVLIDEADVFLEERALHHIERNAMVAVFLRHLEYFRGILFLTTNRVRVFDEAFQSRIHVSLRYHDLTAESRRTIWIAFLRKVHGPDAADGGLTRDQLRELGEKRINGRQIKNVVKTATALATGRQETLGYKHLVQVLDMMDQFDASQSMYN